MVVMARLSRQERPDLVFVSPLWAGDGSSGDTGPGCLRGLGPGLSPGIQAQISDHRIVHSSKYPVGFRAGQTVRNFKAPTQLTRHPWVEVDVCSIFSSVSHTVFLVFKPFPIYTAGLWHPTACSFYLGVSMCFVLTYILLFQIPHISEIITISLSLSDLFT